MPDLSSAPPPAQVRAAGTPESARDSLLMAAVIVVAALYFAREVLIPVTIAVLLSFLLAPLVGLLRRARIGRTPAVLLAVVLALAVILGLGGAIGAQVAGLVGEIPYYSTTIERKVDTVREMTLGRVNGLINRLGHQLSTVPGPPPAASVPTAPAKNTAAQNEQQPIPVEIRQPNPTALDLATRYLSPALSPFATLGIVIIVAIFILLQREDLRDRLIRLIGSGDLHSTTLALDDGARRLSRYFLTQLAINTGFGCVVGIGLYFIGVPHPTLWGILSALLRFVPYIGSLLSAVFPAALAAAVEPGWSMMLWTLALYVVAEGIAGQAVEPLLYGHSTGLSPAAVVIAAIFWSWLWGPVGLVLSTPLTLCLVVLGRHVKRLEFLDVMLGDRPALTPVESFYQRVLAGDADEARYHAETLLRELSLSSYYDEVALKGLQLAAADARRGVLHPDQLERIKETIIEVVGDLAGHEDEEPAAGAADQDPAGPSEDEEALPKHPVPDNAEAEARPIAPEWRGPSAVLCIAGRGPLDEAAAAMLAQLLEKHGIGARLAPYDAVSRANLDALDAAGVMMLCISYLEISGNPAYLRYLLERLKRRLQHRPILVGMWPAADPVLKDPALRREIGADYYTTTLREAVETCLEAARGGAPGEPGPAARPRDPVPAALA
jgi:predicted PurR-regulated permease PerM